MTGALTWFAAYVSVGQERKAADALRDAGFDAYCPMWTRHVVRHRKRIVVSRPLFARYVFVGCADGLWGAARRVDGVEHLVTGASETPATVPLWAIERLRAAEAMGQFDETVKRQPAIPFKPGEPVRVLAGSLQGWVGKVVNADAKGRVHLLIGMLGREVKTIAKAEQLEGVG